MYNYSSGASAIKYPNSTNTVNSPSITTGAASTAGVNSRSSPAHAWNTPQYRQASVSTLTNILPHHGKYIETSHCIVFFPVW